MLTSTWMTVLMLGAMTTATTVAQDQPRDETHPRSPGTPLEIVLTPYLCATCVEDEILPADTVVDIEMMRLPVAELVEQLDLRDDWLALETPHFRFLSTLKKSTLKLKDGNFVASDIERLKTIFPTLSVGGQGLKLDPHMRLHLYHIRAERQYHHFAALTGCEKPFLGMPRKYEVYLFQEYQDHHEFVDRFIGSANDKGAVQWHFRDQPLDNYITLNVCASLAEAQYGKGDAILGNHFMHNIAHNLIDGHNNYIRETWAWLEEGLGHYYERRETPRYNNFCWAEGSPPTELYKPDWEAKVLSLVRREKDLPLGQWCEKLKPGELSSVEHAVCWSMVRWMIEEEPLRFSRLLEHIDDTTNDPSSSDAIEQSFGVSVGVLHQRWREYVNENYGKK